MSILFFSLLSSLILGLPIYGLMWLIGVSLQKPMLLYFNYLWLPSDVKHQPTKGAKLEMVVPQEPRATVWWVMFVWFMTTTLLGTVLSWVFLLWYKYMIFVEVLEITAFTIDSWDYIMMAIVSCSGHLLLPFVYWMATWKNNAERTVIFTDKTFFPEARPTLLPFLTFGLIKSQNDNVYVQPTSILLEVLAVTDIQQLTEQKTPWLRDQWTYYLRKKIGVGSLMLLSKSFKPKTVVNASVLPWICYANGTRNCVLAIAQKSVSMDLVDAGVHKAGAEEAVEALLEGRSGAADRSQKAFDEIMQKASRSYDPAPVYNIFTVQDPGLWDRQNGVPVAQEDDFADSAYTPHEGLSHIWNENG